MAESFNPDVQSINPQNYIYWSRPIESFQGNKAIETMLQGAGSLVKGGTEVATKVQEQGIDEQIQQGVGQINDAALQRMTTAYNDLQGNKYDVLPQYVKDGVEQPPQGLQDSLRKLDVLDAAKAGKRPFSELQLASDKAGLAKQLRTQYPGFKDYIDQRFAAADSPRLPANQQIQLLTQALNSYGQGQQDNANLIVRNATEQYLKGNVAIGTSLNLYKAGKMSLEQLSADVAKSNSYQFDLERQTKQADLLEKQDANRIKIRTRQLDSMVNNTVSDFYHAGFQGIPDVGAYLDQALNSTGEGEQGGMNAQAIVANAGRLKLALETKLRNEIHAQGLDKDMDPATIDARVKAGTGHIQDVIDHMVNKDTGPVDFNARHVKAKGDGIWSEILDHTKYGDAMAVADKLHRDDPTGFDFFMGDMRRQLKMGTNQDMMTFMLQRRGEALTQQHDDVPQTGKQPVTMKSVIEEGIRPGPDGKPVISPEKVGERDSAAFYSNPVKWYQDVLNDQYSPETQTNMAWAIYGAANLGVINYFPASGNVTDPATGLEKPRLGKSDVEQQIYSPQMDKKILQDLGRKDPRLANDYVKGKLEAFKAAGNDELATLNSIQGNPNIEWGWDSNSHQLHARLAEHLQPQTAFNDSQTTGALAQANAVLGRLNPMLHGIATMSQYTKADPDALVMEWLRTSNIQGPVTSAIAKQIGMTHQPKPEPKSEGEKSEEK